MPVSTLIPSLSFPLAVAVGGVKECGIFVNEITPVEAVQRRFVIGCAGVGWRGVESARFVVTDVRRESMKVEQPIRLGCYTEELTTTTERTRQQEDEEEEERLNTEH